MGIFGNIGAGLGAVGRGLGRVAGVGGSRIPQPIGATPPFLPGDTSYLDPDHDPTLDPASLPTSTPSSPRGVPSQSGSIASPVGIPNDRLQALYQDPRGLPQERGGIWRQVGAGLVGGLVGGIANGVFRGVGEELEGRIRYGSGPWDQHQDWQREVGLATAAEGVDRRRDEIEYKRQYQDYLNSLRLQQEDERRRQNDIRQEGVRDRAFGREVEGYNRQLTTLGPKSWEDPGPMRMDMPTPGATGPTRITPAPGAPNRRSDLVTFTAPTMTAGNGFGDVPDILGQGAMSLPAGGQYIPRGSTSTTLPEVRTPEGTPYLPSRTLITPPPGWEKRDLLEAKMVREPQAAGALGLPPDTLLTEAQIREARDIITKGRYSDRKTLVGAKGGTLVGNDGSVRRVGPVGGAGPVTPAPKPPDPYKDLDRRLRARQTRDRALAKAESDATQLRITPQQRDMMKKQAEDAYQEAMAGIEGARGQMTPAPPPVPQGASGVPGTTTPPPIPTTLGSKTALEWEQEARSKVPGITPAQVQQYLETKRKKGLVR